MVRSSLVNSKLIDPIWGNSHILTKKHKKVKTLTNYYSIKDVNDSTLLFESRFESGNLSVATKVSNKE